MKLTLMQGVLVALLATFTTGGAHAGPDLPVNQYVSPDDFAPDITQPPGDYILRGFAGYAWRLEEARTHRVWLGDAFGDRFMARNHEYCTGEAFGQEFDCFEDKVLHLYSQSQSNLQPLYKCFDAAVGDTYISWFEDCDEPGVSGAPTGEGYYPYELGRPDHFLGYLACKAGPFFYIARYDQYDSDGDGVYGDCDIDADDDGLENADDNCPTDYNPGQADWNGDDIGDACDDSDGDGVFDAVDNCLVDANPDQGDYNNNSIGDACENSDGDIWVDAEDNCITIPNDEQRDTNGDGFGNRCDADLDNDCVVNIQDLGVLRAWFFTGYENADLNGDGTVNVIDLGILRTLYFDAPGPSVQPNTCP